MGHHTIKLIDVTTDNITDYKETSLFLVFPYCSGKCGEECQNKELRKLPIKTINNDDIIQLYQKLNTHKAVVCGGLEPIDSFDELCQLVSDFSQQEKNVDFVIYTGYEEFATSQKFSKLCAYWSENCKNNGNLIVKYGMYDTTNKGNWESTLLGVTLATKNQKVIKIDAKGNIIKFEEFNNDKNIIDITTYA